MTIREQINRAMTRLGEDQSTIVCGYNTRYGKAGGSLAGFPEERIWEMPLAENLMLGAAIGASLDGKTPIIWCERMDFALCFADALVNHLDKLSLLSEGLHKPAVIIRICVGNKKVPLFTGPTHCQDFTMALQHLVSFPVVSLWWSRSIETEYENALDRAKAGVSTILVEYKDQLDA